MLGCTNSKENESANSCNSNYVWKCFENIWHHFVQMTISKSDYDNMKPVWESNRCSDALKCWQNKYNKYRFSHQPRTALLNVFLENQTAIFNSKCQKLILLEVIKRRCGCGSIQGMWSVWVIKKSKSAWSKLFHSLKLWRRPLLTILVGKD